MKLLVPVKRVIDFNVKPRVKPDGSGVERRLGLSASPSGCCAAGSALRHAPGMPRGYTLRENNFGRDTLDGGGTEFAQRG